MRFSYRMIAAALGVTVMFLVGGCPTPPQNSNSNTNSNQNTNANDPGSRAVLIGAWERVNAPSADANRDNLFDLLARRTRWIEFFDDGTLRITDEDPESGVIRCRDAIFGVFPDGPIAVSLFGSNVSALFQRVQATADGLVLDDGDFQFEFRRIAATPAEVACRTLRVVRQITPLGRAPSFATSLVFDSNRLLYTSVFDTVPIDIQSGELGTPFQLTGSVGSTVFAVAKAIDDGEFWSLPVAVGTDPLAVRQTLAGVVTEQLPAALVGGPFPPAISAIAADPATGRVWMHVPSVIPNVGELFRIATAGEPNVAEASVPFNEVVAALTFDGASLWALTANGIVRVDPLTMKGLETFQLPVLNETRWRGIAVVDPAAPRIFLIGSDFSTTNVGVLVELAP